MSDFFSNLYGGIRQPDVVINGSGGPLPPSSTMGGGYPEGFGGVPDGKINLASTLLGDVNPYAYGEADRLSTQTAYLNVPHRTQRIIPSLDLPEAQPWNSGGSFFRLSHQVDDGDIAFVIRAMFSPYELVAEKKKYNKQGILYAVDPVVNLATVNYILHGLQRFGYDKKNVSWHTLWQALGIDQHFSKRYKEGLSTIMCMWRDIIDGGSLAASGISIAREILGDGKGGKENDMALQCRFMAMAFMRQLRREVVDHLVKNIIRPFGIPTGSEKQGGQHQGSNSAITWPVDFVTTLTIDGLVINMVNFWRHEDLNSGDDLMLYVEDRPYQEYVLSHHPKNVKKQVFPSLKAWEMPAALAQMHEESSTSISPGTLAMDRMCEVLLQAMSPNLSDPLGFIHGKFTDALGASGGMILTGTPPDGTGGVDMLDSSEKIPAGDGEALGIPEIDHETDGDDMMYDSAEIDSHIEGYGKFMGKKDLSIATQKIVGFKRNRDEWSREAAAHPRSRYYLPGTDRALIRTRPYEMHSIFEVMCQLFAAVQSGDLTKVVGKDAVDKNKIFDPKKDMKLDKHVVDKLKRLLGDNAQEKTQKLQRFVTIKESIFQLVPGISSSSCTGVREAVWRYGYWHIARSQVMHFKYDQHLDIPNGYHAAVRGKVLQATFAPVWVEPLEDAGMGGVGVSAGFTGAWDTEDRRGRKKRTLQKQRIVSVQASSMREDAASSSADKEWTAAASGPETFEFILPEEKDMVPAPFIKGDEEFNALGKEVRELVVQCANDLRGFLQSPSFDKLGDVQTNVVAMIAGIRAKTKAYFGEDKEEISESDEMKFEKMGQLLMQHYALPAFAACDEMRLDAVQEYIPENSERLKYFLNIYMKANVQVLPKMTFPMDYACSWMRYLEPVSGENYNKTCFAAVATAIKLVQGINSAPLILGCSSAKAMKVQLNKIYQNAVNKITVKRAGAILACWMALPATQGKDLVDSDYKEMNNQIRAPTYSGDLETKNNIFNMVSAMTGYNSNFEELGRIQLNLMCGAFVGAAVGLSVMGKSNISSAIVPFRGSGPAKQKHMQDKILALASKYMALAGACVGDKMGSVCTESEVKELVHRVCLMFVWMCKWLGSCEDVSESTDNDLLLMEFQKKFVEGIHAEAGQSAATIIRSIVEESSGSMHTSATAEDLKNLQYTVDRSGMANFAAWATSKLQYRSVGLIDGDGDLPVFSGREGYGRHSDASSLSLRKKHVASTESLHIKPSVAYTIINCIKDVLLIPFPEGSDLKSVTSQCSSDIEKRMQQINVLAAIYSTNLTKDEKQTIASSYLNDVPIGAGKSYEPIASNIILHANQDMHRRAQMTRICVAAACASVTVSVSNSMQFRDKAVNMHTIPLEFIEDDWVDAHCNDSIQTQLYFLVAPVVFACALVLRGTRDGNEYSVNKACDLVKDTMALTIVKSDMLSKQRDGGPMTTEIFSSGVNEAVKEIKKAEYTNPEEMLMKEIVTTEKTDTGYLFRKFAAYAKSLLEDTSFIPLSEEMNSGGEQLQLSDIPKNVNKKDGGKFKKVQAKLI